MTKTTEHTITIIGFPYTSRPDTGRGIDRYLYELSNGIVQTTANFRILECGIVKPKFTELILSSVKIFKELLITKSAVYHAVDPFGAFFAIILNKRPLITTIHDTIPLAPNSIQLIKELGKIRIPLSKGLLLISLKLSTKLVVPFEITKTELVTIYGVNAEKIKKINYSIQLTAGGNQRPYPSTDKSCKLLKILFIGGGNPVARGLKVVLSAYNELKNSGVNASLTLVGNTEIIHQELAIFRIATDDSIEVSKFIPEDELQSFFERFDIFFYPSSLGFSFLVPQAMHAGTPVIVSDSRDMKEFIGDYDLVCAPEDVDCFVQFALKIYKDPNYRNVIIRESVNRASKFSSSKIIKEILELYEEVTSGKKN